MTNVPVPASSASLGKRPRARRSDAVYAALKAEILDGDLPLGVRLYEVTVAERFDASRTPVREALMRLQADGLIERQGRAYRLRSTPIDLVRQLFQAREALESLAIEQAIGRQSPEGIAELERLVDEMKVALDARDNKRFNRLDVDFHRTIARIAGNEFVSAMLGEIYDKVLMVRNYLFPERQRQIDADAEHRRILEAFRRGDAAIGVAEIRFHLRTAIAILEERQLTIGAEPGTARGGKAAGGGNGLGVR